MAKHTRLWPYERLPLDTFCCLYKHHGIAHPFVAVITSAVGHVWKMMMPRHPSIQSTKIGVHFLKDCACVYSQCVLVQDSCMQSLKNCAIVYSQCALLHQSEVQSLVNCACVDSFLQESCMQSVVNCSCVYSQCVLVQKSFMQSLVDCACVYSQCALLQKS